MAASYQWYINLTQSIYIISFIEKKHNIIYGNIGYLHNNTYGQNDQSYYYREAIFHI
jgi:hypothetical protein